MSITLLPVLLASASSLLLPPLSAATGEVSSIDMDDLSFWLLLAVAPGLVMLVALGIHFWGNPRIDDEPSAPTAPLVDTERDELARFMRDTIEQLNGIAAELRDTIPEAGQAPSQGASDTRGLGRDNQESRDAAATEEGIAESVGTLDESAPRTGPLPLGSAFEAMRSVTRDKALAQLAVKMRKLTELASRMQDEKEALERHAMDPQPAVNGPSQNRHYLTFTLGDEQFAISTLSVYGVVEATQLIAEPSMPPKIRKAIRLRGALVPVIDLGARFGGQPIEIGWSSRIVILEVASGDRLQLIGVVVDAVGKVLELPPTEIEPAAASGSRIRDDFTRGTTTVDNRPVTLLDFGRGVSANDLIVLRSAARSTAQENEPA